MLKALLLLLNLALAVMVMAQDNLVRNGSFEDTVSCELPVIGIRKATHWYTANSATPDVWDADLERECGYPLDPEGFPGLSYIAPFHGLRHAGGYYWYGPGSSNTREYIMTRLATPLLAGNQYEISLQVALRGNMRYAIDHIGVWLGWDSLYEPQPNWLSVTPQLKLRDPQYPYLTRTDVWTLVKDTMVAVGGEEWLVIGNFDVADSVNGILAHPEAFNSKAYYFIDSVGVRELRSPTSVAEHGLLAGWSTQGLWVRSASGQRIGNVQLFDAQGRIIAIGALQASSGMVELPATFFASGLYIVRASVGDQWLTTRFIKEEGGF